MAKFNRVEVFLQMSETKLVPVFYNPNEEICLNVIKACYKGGIRVFEFTNRGDYAHTLFSKLVIQIRNQFPNIILGAGSIVDAPTAAIYIQNGADFIVSPLLNPGVAKICNRRKIMWIPGCGSVSEIGQAEELGAEIIKIFPGSQVGGPGFVKAVKGPMPWTNIMPTGGVSPEKDNLKAWFDSGATCVGIGSKLITKEIIENNDYDLLEQKVRNTLEIISSIT